MGWWIVVFATFWNIFAGVFDHLLKQEMHKEKKRFRFHYKHQHLFVATIDVLMDTAVFDYERVAGFVLHFLTIMNISALAGYDKKRG